MTSSTSTSPLGLPEHLAKTKLLFSSDEDARKAIDELDSHELGLTTYHRDGSSIRFDSTAEDDIITFASLSFVLGTLVERFGATASWA